MLDKVNMDEYLTLDKKLQELEAHMRSVDAPTSIYHQHTSLSKAWYKLHRRASKEQKMLGDVI